MVVDVGARTTTLVIAKLPDALLLAREVQLGAQALAEAGAQDWVAELRDSLVYIRSREGLRGPDVVYMTGGGGSSQACALLQSLVGVPVQRWNPLDQLKRHPASPPVDSAVGPLLPIAIGLALRQPS
jgi:Tfp pilus assembly PilM family ATPase